MLTKKQLKRVCDAVQHLPMFRVDVDAGIYARQLVTETISEIFRHEYEAAKWFDGTLFPIDTSLNEGANEYSWNELAPTGLAKIVADNGTDVPMVDVEGQSNVAPVKTVACAFSYTRQQVRTAMMSGMFNLPQEKAQAARESHDYALHNFIRDGVPEKGLLGFSNAPGLVVQSAITGGWTSGATPVQILADFSAAVNSIMNTTTGVEMPNSAVFPLAEYLHISSTPWDATNGSNVFILDMMKKAHPMITQWEWDPGMATIGTGGTGASLIYNKNTSKARAVMPMILTPTAPQEKDLAFKVVLESRFGGVMTPKPKSATRLEGI